MSLFQKLGNAWARFMYGRNRADQLGLFMLVIGILVNLASRFVKNATISLILSLLAGVIVAIVLFRIFSRNLYKRRSENAKFLNKVWWPIKRFFNRAKTKNQDKEHKYFTCSKCRAVCRVPRGKGKIVITCPRCGNQIHGKS